ncbi:MAG: hypothetical protein ACLR76_04955 [Alistipes sp.]
MRKFGNTGGSESNMRIKVAVGYLLVAVAAVFAVWYIYKRIAPLAVREDATQGAAYRKVLVTGTTIRRCTRRATGRISICRTLRSVIWKPTTGRSTRSTAISTRFAGYRYLPSRSAFWRRLPSC